MRMSTAHLRTVLAITCTSLVLVSCRTRQTGTITAVRERDQLLLALAYHPLSGADALLDDNLALNVDK